MYDAQQFKDMLDEINHHAQYLSDTINDSATFKPDNPEDMMLSQVMEDTLSIIGKPWNTKCAIIKLFLFGSWLRTYPSELRQVFKYS